MVRVQTFRLALLVSCCGIGALAQTAPQPQTAPAPAFGQNAPILSPDNPPVSGLDEPALELRTASRSFISPGLQLSESGDSNPSNQVGASNSSSITRLLGALDLQQFWPKSDLFLEYVGGGAFYADPYFVKQLHSAGLEGVTRWRTGQATLRDVFSYLPDGSFNLGFGGVPGFGIATGQGMGTGLAGSLPGSIHPNQGAPVLDIPRLANTAILDVVQAVNPRSAFTVAGAFSNTHFYDNTPPTLNPVTLANSDQVTVQGGYSHLLSRHDQIGAIYAFQLFQFPQSTGGEVYNHIVNLRWSHTISGRMSFIAGAGPQYTDLQNGGEAKHWSLSARVQLHYKFAHSSLVATYEKFTSAGSGIFAGANTQTARLGYNRPLGRTWELYGDLSYSHNAKLQNVSFLTGALNAADSYDEGSALVLLRKHLGRTYDFFTSYRFSEVGFNTPPGTPGGTISQRQSGTIGVEWHPTPKRID